MNPYTDTKLLLEWIVKNKRECACEDMVRADHLEEEIQSGRLSVPPPGDGLLACPFCGEAAQETPHPGGNGIQVGCVNDQCPTHPYRYGIAAHRKHIYEDWNTRSAIANYPVVNAGVVEALNIGIKWMEWWVNNQSCDCEYGHVCGWLERERELKQMKAAIANVGGGCDPVIERDRLCCTAIVNTQYQSDCLKLNVTELLKEVERLRALPAAPSGEEKVDE